jgi:hypothetical protein
VYIPLNNGSTQRISVNTGLNPWRNQFIPGPLQWSLDGSLFKVVTLTESVRLRINADWFNVLNHPGNANSIGGGILSTNISGNSARLLQLSMRLTW